MALPSNFDRAATLGALANAHGLTMEQVVADLTALFAPEAARAWDDRRAALGRVVDVFPHVRSSDLLGPVSSPPPVPVPDGSEPEEVHFADANTAPGYVLYGSRKSLSVQKMSSLSAESYRRAILAMTQHASDAVEEAVADSLNGASLPASQTATTLAEALSEYSLLETPDGGFAPPLGGVLADESLRGRASDESWDRWGVPLHFARLGTSGRLYLLPRPETGAVVMSVIPGFSVSSRTSANSVAGWQFSGIGFANESPTVRSGYFVRGTLS